MKQKKDRKIIRSILSLLFRFIYKSVIVLLSLLFVLSVIVFIAFKFDRFRQPIVNYAVEQANSFLLAEVSLEDMIIHRFNYIQLKDLLVEVRGDTLLYARRVNFNFNPLSFNSKHIQISRLKFEDAYFNMKRYKSDSLWNFNLIARKSDIEKEPGQMPDLILDVNDIQFFRSKFVYRDSTRSIRINSNPEYPQMDYSDFEINDIFGDIDAKIFLKDNIYRISIDELKAKERYSGFVLEELSLDAELSEKGIALNEVKIKSPRSEVYIDGNLHNLSIFKPIDIAKVNFELNLKGSPLDVRDALFFANTGIEIRDADEVEIETNGILDELNIKKLKIRKNATDLSLNGKVKNILNIENFNYSVLLDKSLIYRKDIIAIIPEFETIIPKIQNIKINKLEANGFLDSVFCDFDFNSDAGSAKGAGSIMYIGNMNYDVNVSTDKINLSKIIDNKDLKSSITGDFYIKGSGISLENIAAEIDVNAWDSYISEYKFSDLRVKINSNNKKMIYLDTFYLEMPRNIKYSTMNDVFTEDNSILLAEGFLNMQGNIPVYSINVDYSALDITGLIDNSSMPEYASGNIKLNASGFEPDEIDGSLVSSFDELLFDDRALFPFDLNVEVSHPDSVSKEISVVSDFFRFTLNGIYSIEDLFANFQIQSDILQNFIEYHTGAILNDTESKASRQFVISKNFPDINAQITGNVINIAPLAAFIDDTDVHFSGDFDMSFLSDSSQSTINMNNFDIKKLDFYGHGISLNSESQSFSGNLNFENIDSTGKLTNLNFRIDKSSEIYFNGNIYDSTSLNLSFEENRINWNVGSSFNEIIYAEAKGDIFLKDSLFNINISDLLMDYTDIIKIDNSDVLELTYFDNMIDINKFKLSVDSLNNLDLSGKIGFRKEKLTNDSTEAGIYFDDITVNMVYEDLQNFRKFLPGSINKKLTTLNADLTKFELVLKGDLSNPQLLLSSEISDIELQQYKLGNLKADAELKDYRLSLSSTVIGNNDKEYLYAVLESLTLNESNFSIDSLSEINADITMSDLPLPLISPFIPMLNDMTGNASSDINISGFALNPEINGTLNLKSTSFVLETNNVKYYADGDINFTIDEIETVNLVLKNTKKDSENGIAKVNAKIIMRNFAPEYFDISADAKNFKLLSNASQDAMPDLYGDLVISTGRNPLKFEGSLDDPRLSGDVNVVYADLKMPEFTEQQNAKTQLRYQIVGDKVRHSIKNKSDSTVRIKKDDPSNIMNVMDFNMRVKLLGQVSVLIDLGALGEIYANVTMENKDEDLIYQKNTENNSENLTGRIILKDNSTFKSFKVLQTSGEISFPTGEIDNPYLDLEATYKGTTMINNQPKQYTVIMYITGSQEQPKVRFTYLIDGQEAVGDAKQIEEDAILLLVAGRTKSSSGQGAASPDMLQQSLNSGISNYGSQLLTDFLIKTGSIQSVDLDFKGEGFDEATVKFTGQTELFGGSVNWTIGGALSDFSGNNEIILDVPLTNYTDNEFWRNFIFQFTRASHTNTTIQDQNSKNWEIKFKVGGSF